VLIFEVMALLEKYLFIKRSKIPKAGKGLFTTVDVKKGTFIVEYKGRVTTWRDVQQSKGFNGYMYYIDRNQVIDAKPFKRHLGRYANDANGIVKLKGVRNNSTYKVRDNKVFIKAIKNITAGAEILVSYGKEYWDVIKYNNGLKKKSLKKATRT
jgi:SET domain-containing protein